MDILSITKEKIIAIRNFSVEQFGVWLRIVSNPVTVISRFDLTSRDSIFPALHFAVFVYILSFVLAIPKFVIYYRIDISNKVIVLTDFVINSLAFVLFGVCLHISGWIVSGRGRLGQGLLAGLYLMAFWPILVVLDYVIFAELYDSEPPIPEKFPLDSVPILYVVLLAIFGIYIFVKVVPVVKHIYSIGIFRASIATILCFVLFVYTSSEILSKMFMHFINRYGSFLK